VLSFCCHALFGISRHSDRYITKSYELFRPELQPNSTVMHLVDIGLPMTASPYQVHHEATLWNGDNHQDIG
jgi:hypothetical protein